MTKKEADQEWFVQGEPVYYAHRLSPLLNELKIIPISDVHRGNPLFSVKHLDRTLDMIASDEEIYTILNGDLCEAALKTSKGEIYHQVGSPQEQRDWMIDRLTPIRQKILGMTMGNHEYRIYKETGIDICKDIAKALNVPYRAEGIILKIMFGSGNNRTPKRPYTYWGYATHGYGGARTKSAKAVKAERAGHWIPKMDFIIMSHDHTVNVAPDVCLMTDPRTRVDKETGFMVGKVVAHRRMLVKSNAYLKWGGYSEMGGFPPVDLEAPIIKLSGTGKPRVRVEV